MTTALFTHEDCFDHVTPSGHPEQVARLDAVLTALEGLPLKRHAAPLAADDDILLAHPSAYLDRIKSAVPDAGWAQLDADTHMSSGSLAAAYRAVGGAVRAVDLVLDGTRRNAFVATRPPGHHAERETAMGFCLFGNIAIAAKHALERHGLERVAIIDFDVHHGNGTQDLVDGDDRILFISSHQMPLYPGTGDPRENAMSDTIRNFALRDGDGGPEFRKLYTREVFPLVADFAPQLILISAGFDAHAADPLAGLRLVEEDFAWVTEKICDLADEFCEGRLVSLLEGGYDLVALGNSARAHVTVLEERGR
jgi:acetoin utilization deacetylase AcuC-like enzyme